ncbi:MAG: DNA repair protein [Sphingobacteriales bacterium 17-39-43]|uniref:JAB domain-containing protein n=1 Tax=Daejeonella sp. TaxID=2805397 RepID=UPI000BD66A64|nr:JAB domain-containing protein [Daejeonella sp.]OYZ28634.1 MAG: DNA repair protein [Sphingobacteriales bacterium 16-39-50]OZA22443.1 MAG: DNA repair protein [Sphingobacteriales bacterium 17-39-43]HQT24752.1 JAB domain-containing protein [Daejeonella sp.]HQT57828.1 JAB domain-containing protein [Daejeonella sp.]
MVTNPLTTQVSEIKLSYKLKQKASDLPQITTSAEVYSILIANWDKGLLEFLEQFKIILLNRANKVLGIAEISLGGVSGTLADPKVIFATALKACASSIILAHNHPSGNLKPSTSDIDLTNKLKAGGLLLDITVFDHIIVTSEGYYSFADEGIM